jgi:hypothetical protein
VPLSWGVSGEKSFFKPASSDDISPKRAIGRWIQPELLMLLMLHRHTDNQDGCSWGRNDIAKVARLFYKSRYLPLRNALNTRHLQFSCLLVSFTGRFHFTRLSLTVHRVDDLSNLDKMVFYKRKITVSDDTVTSAAHLTLKQSLVPNLLGGQ